LQFQEPEILFETFSINIISAMKLIALLTERFNYNTSIVFISSVMGLVGQSAKLSYCASKGAITAFTRSLALEYTSRKIRVNSILPGVVKTPLFETLMDKLPSESLENIYTQHPLGLGEPADIAHLVLFLLSDMSKYINGSSIAIDGGYLSK
jgi:NAD(P)-dependent dehydrogenase (short-subunit alcohol dehydrogenase family)